MDAPYNDLGAVLRQRRLALGLTQEQLAARANTYQESISEWECGTREPSRISLRKLAIALGTDDLTLMAKAREWARKEHQHDPPSSL